VPQEKHGNSAKTVTEIIPNWMLTQGKYVRRIATSYVTAIGIIKTEGIACRTNGNMFKFYTNLKLIFSQLLPFHRGHTPSSVLTPLIVTSPIGCMWTKNTTEYNKRLRRAIQVNTELCSRRINCNLLMWLEPELQAPGIPL